MAKIRGPLHSLEAHGNLNGGMLQFRGAGASAHAYRPRAPRRQNQLAATPAQSNQRARFARARAAWTLLDNAARAEWRVKERPYRLTGWNLYLSIRLKLDTMPELALLTDTGFPLLIDLLDYLEASWPG